MHITTYLQPERTYLPCTGVGKYINNILLDISRRNNFNVSLLVSQEYLSPEGKLDTRSPLHNLNLCIYPYKRLLTERLWKFCDLPKMDRFIGEADCIYSPVAEYIPVRKNIPMIITMYDMHTLETDLPWSNSKSQILERLKTKVWIYKSVKKADHIFTISNYSKQRIIELIGVKAEKISVIGCGVENAFFTIDDSDKIHLPHPILDPYVIVIGGLRYKKGGYYVIEVAKELKNRKSSLKIVVVGSNETELVKIANTLDNIVIVGVISEDQLLQFLGMASSLLFLSLYEGFGIPMLEAMAAGVPSVVANRGSLPSVGNPAAIVVEPENAGMIADILINLERDTQLRSQYVQIGREHASQFKWKDCVDKVVDVLNKYS